MAQFGGKTYEKHLSQPHFFDIKCGHKIYEGRLKTGDFADFKAGDIVIWHNSDSGKKITTITKITEIREYPTFYAAINDVGLHHVLPSEYAKYGNDIKGAIDRVYRTWYSEEKEKQFGVILIHIEVMK